MKKLSKVLIVLLMMGFIGCESKTNTNLLETNKNTKGTYIDSENHISNKDFSEEKIPQDKSSEVGTEKEIIYKEESGSNIGVKSFLEDYPYHQELNIIEDNYRTYYEVFLYSFYDSDGDGIGDIQGLIEKLDYINDGDSSTHDDLGFNGIWLMPIMPSSTYHKYDVENYYEIDKEYGSIEDFKELVRECEKRGIKLIIDLVMNHSSNLHPWFLSAISSLVVEPCNKAICSHKDLCREHNPYVNYYHFAEEKPMNGKYYSTGKGSWYYEAVFSSNMPDLNLDDDNLVREFEQIMKYWLELGVGGFRLDAVMHFYDNDTQRNVEALSHFNQYVKSIKEDTYMVAEVWTNFSKYVKYYESGIDSVFNFAFATETGIIANTLNQVNNKNRGKAFAEAMLQVQTGVKNNNIHGMDASFFTNHDTARGAGYFQGNLDKIKMATGLNLMMSGSSFVYYGEELAMSGVGRDENKRAPMVWSYSTMKGMTKGPKDMEEVTHNYPSLEEQKEDLSSIYHYIKHGVRLRNETPEIARGTITEIISFDTNEATMIKKEYLGKSIYIAYNFTGESLHLQIPQNLGKELEIIGYLNTGIKNISIENGKLELAPYGIVVIK